MNKKYIFIKLTVQHGVPQGSISGPLLFLAYINDITEITGSSELIMYADKTNIFFHGGNKENPARISECLPAETVSMVEPKPVKLECK